MSHLAASGISLGLASVWMGACLIVAALLLLRVVPELPARWRYRVWMTVLALTLIGPFLASALRSTAVSPSLDSVSAGGEGAAVTAEAGQVPQIAGAPLRIAPPVGPGAVSLSSRPVPALPEEPRFTRLEFPRIGLTLIGLLLLIGTGVSLFRIPFELRALGRLKRRAAEPSDRLLRLWREALSRLPSGRTLRVLVSGDVPLPVACGYLQPAVLVPRGMNGCLTDEETRHLLLHELAHLNRRDDWALLIERTIEAFCWWHPVVRWVGSRLEQEREEACDQLAATGEEPRRYASTLVHLAEISKAAGSRLAPGALRGQLSRRVEALLATPALGRGRLVHRVPAFSLSLAILTVGSRVAPPSIVARTPVPDSIPAAAPPTSGAAVASLDSLFTAYADSGFSGTILLARHGRIVLEKGYGLADRERGIPATAETRYSTAGMTKLFTAAAILDLAETGRLSLQDPASRWFGELGRTKGTVTLDQLLTYRDGLTRLNAPVQRDDPSAFLQALAAAPASFTPGSGYRYSDHGHSLLGLVIEAASGESYESYVRRRFIGPAGLTHTGFENEPGSVAVEYSGPADALAPVGPRAYRWGRRASLGLVSTAGDLYRWFNKLSDPAVISPAVREQLFQVRTRTDYNTDQAYGLELVDRERGHRLWRRVAGTPGFEGELLHDPDNDWTAVILVNTRLGWRFKVWREIERVMWSVPGSPSTS